MARCYNKNSKRFANYGGRGIRVCERWHDPKNFFADMAQTHKPGLQLDRIDVHGDYRPENCRWVDDHTQRRNRRNNITITIDGTTKNLADWCKDLGVRYGLAFERIKVNGWDPQRALLTPPAKVRNR